MLYNTQFQQHQVEFYVLYNQYDCVHQLFSYILLNHKNIIKAIPLTDGDNYDENGEFRVLDNFQYLLEQKGCVLIAQANERFDHLIERLPGEKQKYLSMWKGYVKEDCDAYNEKLANSLGKDYLYMHTSGHCDVRSIRELFSMLHPSGIIPIHTDKPDDFVKLFDKDWPVIRLHDGEAFAIKRG